MERFSKITSNNSFGIYTVYERFSYNRQSKNSSKTAEKESSENVLEKSEEELLAHVHNVTPTDVVWTDTVFLK